MSKQEGQNKKGSKKEGGRTKREKKEKRGLKGNPPPETAQKKMFFSIRVLIGNREAIEAKKC